MRSMPSGPRLHLTLVEGREAAWEPSVLRQGWEPFMVKLAGGGKQSST